jgi:hypothetical protein
MNCYEYARSSVTLLLDADGLATVVTTYRLTPPIDKPTGKQKILSSEWKSIGEKITRKIQLANKQLDENSFEIYAQSEIKFEKAIISVKGGVKAARAWKSRADSTASQEISITAAIKRRWDTVDMEVLRREVRLRAWTWKPGEGRPTDNVVNWANQWLGHPKLEDGECHQTLRQTEINGKLKTVRKEVPTEIYRAVADGENGEMVFESGTYTEMSNAVLRWHTDWLTGRANTAIESLMGPDTMKGLDEASKKVQQRKSNEGTRGGGGPQPMYFPPFIIIEPHDPHKHLRA